MEIEVESCVRGHHVYSTIWNPVLGERLTYKRELDNDMLWQYVKMKTLSSVTFHRRYHFFVQYLLEEAAQLKTLARKDSRKLSKT